MIYQVAGNNESKMSTQSDKINNVKKFDYSIPIKIVRIMGLMALISYISVILYTWIYANEEGFIYFSAGEPSMKIRYSEWILGFLGIFVAIYYLLMELSGYNYMRATKS